MYLFTLCFLTAQASIKVISPSVLRDQYKNGIDSSLGNFGNPPYNSYIIGNLWYNTSQNGCSPINLGTVHEDSDNLIVMLNRGECAFVSKVKQAQDVGAKAVIIANQAPCTDIKNTIMRDNGMGGNLFIPAMIINCEDVSKLKQYVQSPGVTLSLGFELPENPELITMTLVFSSAQKESQDFMKMFKSIGEKLTPKNVYLETHYVVFKCIGCQRNNFDIEMVDCLGGGRYCAPDPDGINGRLTGRDVVEEDLRQICVLESVKSERSEYVAYFTYLKEFATNCVAKDFNKECSEKSMKTAGINVQSVKTCYESSFTERSKSQTLSSNTKLDIEVEHWKGYGRSVYPAVIINQQLYRGDMEESALIVAICAGYFKGTEPEFCKNGQEIEIIEGFSATTVVLGLLLFFGILVALLFGYRYYAKKELEKEMRVQVNSAVNQYFALSDTSTFKKNPRSS